MEYKEGKNDLGVAAFAWPAVCKRNSLPEVCTYVACIVVGVGERCTVVEEDA